MTKMIIIKMINMILLRQCASFKSDNNKKKNLYVHVVSSCTFQFSRIENRVLKGITGSKN